MSDGALAHYYDSKYSGESQGRTREVVTAAGVPRDRFEACVARVPRLFRGGRLLELGAGSGLVARSLVAGGLEFEEYVVSERSESRLAGLRQSVAHPRVGVAAIDAECVPDELFGGFDAVLMVALVEHLVDPLAALTRIRRLLKPGGFLYLDTPNIAKYTRRTKLLFGRFPSTASRDEGLQTYAGEPVDLHDEGHLHYFTYRSLSRLLVERCGFAEVEKLPYFTGGRLLGSRLDHALAQAWPEMFAELCIAARV